MPTRRFYGARRLLDVLIRVLLAVLVGEAAAAFADGPADEEDPSSFFGCPVDKTRLTERETLGLPTAGNLWSLLENQIPGAITDRVDVGGLRGDEPARFGGFGSSWTQNTVLLDGLDITDRVTGERPALFPDLDAFQAVDVSTTVHPASLGSPGVVVALVPRQGGDAFHGGFSLFGQGDRTQSDNLTEDMREKGVTSTERFGTFGSGSVHAGGPLLDGNMHYFFSGSGTFFTKTPQNTADSASSDLSSGLLNLTADLGGHSLGLLWAGDALHDPRAGLSAFVPVSATLDERERFGVLKLRDRFTPADGLTLTSQAGFVASSLDRDLQQGVTQQPGLEMFEGQRTGAAPMATSASRRLFTLDETLEGRTGPVKWQAGFSWEELFSTSSWRTLDGVEAEFLNGQAVEAILWNAPGRSRDRERNLSVFFQGRSPLGRIATVDAGLNLRISRAWLPDVAAPAISWTTLSPRVQISVPLGRKLIVRTGWARYYHQLLASLLDYEDPAAPGGRVVAWSDPNGDGRFEPGEAGQLLRVFGGGHSSVDPGLKAPFTDEFMIAGRLPGRLVDVEVTATQRYEQRLVGLTDPGVPFSSYTPVTIHDNGADGIPGTADDQNIVVWNQSPATLGKDAYVLTNPSGFRTFYQGIEIVLRLPRTVRNLDVVLSMSASRHVGMASQEGDAHEYDEGVIGSLYTNPNTLINADGRLYFDRSFVAKAAASYRLPWGFSLGAVAKYWDGQPYAREIIVTGLNQGPFYILASPRGNGWRTPVGGVRTEAVTTLDLSLKKEVRIASASLLLRVDVFNALNANDNTIENDLSGPDFDQRRPLENVAPRVVRFGMSLEF